MSNIVVCQVNKKTLTDSCFQYEMGMYLSCLLHVENDRYIQVNYQIPEMLNCKMFFT